MKSEMTFIEHLAELRKRIIITVAPILIFTAVFYYYMPVLFKYLMKFINKFSTELVCFSITEAFIVRFKFSLVLSAIGLVPWILFQIIVFIRPGLKENEIKLLYKSLFLLFALLTSGILFGYFVVLPYVLNFFVTYGTSYMEPILSGDRYMSFIILTCLITGIVFVLPGALAILGSIGALSVKQMRKWRKYVILTILAFEAIIIPTNEFAIYFLMALPVLMLYETGIWIVYFFRKSKVENNE